MAPVADCERYGFAQTNIIIEYLTIRIIIYSNSKIFDISGFRIIDRIGTSIFLKSEVFVRIRT